MSLVFDLTTMFNAEPVPSDTLTPSGSLFGSQLTYGVSVINPGVQWSTGSWLGSDQSWGVNGASPENHDTTTPVNNENPRVLEGINMGEYNVFPYPETPPEEPQKIRDATRFQKAYSFSRHQPVRIRVYKR